MTHCRECNSEITDVDAFCPFCGINIEKPIDEAEGKNIADDLEVGAELDSSVLSQSESDTDSDMSETIAASPEELLANTEQDGGFVDISALKEKPETDEKIAAETEVDLKAEPEPATSVEDSTEDLKDLDESHKLDQSDSDIEFESDSPIDTTEIIEDADDVPEVEATDDAPEVLDGDSGDIISERLDKSGEMDSQDGVEDSVVEPEKVDKEFEFEHPAPPKVIAAELEPDQPTGLEADNAETRGEANDPQVGADLSTADIDKDVDEALDTGASDDSAPALTSEKPLRSDDQVGATDSVDIEEPVSSSEAVPLSGADDSAGHEEADVQPEIIQSGEDLEAESNDIEKSVSEPGFEAETIPEDIKADSESQSGETKEDTGIAKDAGRIEKDDFESPLPTEMDVESPPPIQITSSAIVASDDTALSPSEGAEAPEPGDYAAKSTADEPGTEPAGGKLPFGEDVSDNQVVEKIEEIGEGGEVDIADTPADESKSGVESIAEKEIPGTTPNIAGADTDGSNTPKLRPLDEGTVLNSRYEIVRKIGGGGMGAVYLASDKNLGGVLRAVKEMVQSYIEKEQQEKAVQDFKRESMLLTSLEHAAIPTIYDYFFDEKEARFYLVMKYISGGDLAARLRAAPEGRLDEISVTQWAMEVSDVLAYLHNRKPPIVYRDLKPANIMIDGNSSRIMLIDFGIARWVNKEEKGVTAVGTMGYAPPELFSGNVVPSSDIYSLGSTMFHLLTGADPQNNPLLIFDFQKHPRPRQINPNLSDQMERILMKSVEYNSDGRFTSADEMRNELEKHLHNLKTGSVSYGIKESPAAIALSDQPVFCGFCGQKIVATDMFCAFCGAKQPLAQPGVHSQEYSIPQTTAKLFVEGTGDLNVPTFDLGKKENLVGRRDPMSNIFPEVDLSKFDPQTKVSRKHARIWRDGDMFMLEDLGSSNGTIVNQPGSDARRLAPHQAHSLANGDRIQLGDTVLHFVLG
jgi:serine/threonine-protein kinase